MRVGGQSSPSPSHLHTTDLIHTQMHAIALSRSKLGFSYQRHHRTPYLYLLDVCLSNKEGWHSLAVYDYYQVTQSVCLSPANYSARSLSLSLCVCIYM